MSHQDGALRAAMGWPVIKVAEFVGKTMIRIDFMTGLAGSRVLKSP